MEALRINESDDMRDNLLLFGGVALIMLGAGMVLTSPAVRKYLGGVDLARLLRGAAPDFERYLKLKAM